MADRYLAPQVAQLVDTAARRPVAWAEDRIRRDGRRFYAESKEKRLRELLLNYKLNHDTVANGNAQDQEEDDPDMRRKLTNLASAEASRKKKQYIQDRSFATLRKVCTGQKNLAKAVVVLIAANERQRKENLRIAALLAAASNANTNNDNNNNNNNSDNSHRGDANGSDNANTNGVCITNNNGNSNGASPSPQVTNPNALDLHPQQMTTAPHSSFDILSSPVTSCNTGSNTNNSLPSPQFAPLHHHEAVISNRAACAKAPQDCHDFATHHSTHHPNHNPNHDHNTVVQCDRTSKVEEDRFDHFGTVDAERFLSMH